jgi:mycothiol synthase
MTATVLELQTQAVAAGDYVLRAPSALDAERITALIVACCLADGGVIDHSLAEQQANWRRPGFNRSTDAWMALARDGTLAGYAEVWARERQPGAEQRFVLNAHVHPQHRGRGLGTRLFARMVARAEAHLRALPRGTSGRLTAFSHEADADARAIFERAGFRAERHAWTLRRDLDAEPQAPAWPEGLTVRAFVPGQDDAATHALINEAFADLPGHVPSRLDDWRARLMAPDLFRPEYWFLACDGSSLAGCALGYGFPEAGWLATLAVRSPYRERGLALSLLQHCFAEFYRSGHPALELGLDGTAATRVYERAGMRIVRKQVVFEKVIGNE